ncbi:FkbM family methyltransferase [Sphingosinicella rhizophila]|uniref:FkbM family methyltransferase n=1 Tax=Sphingosinicella rhizophila TaxID=3050082 RepID=A0ABU3QAI2_9SPHN|nr:FkbM family methyltransferase [Sphingosinicella sp. GR2756]MDT9600302.1 FkbM family methyltransferase [Sphingosinicella sp. GR2756]
MTYQPAPSLPIKIFRRLPFGRQLALRLYNRFLMHLWPNHTVTTYFGAQLNCNARDVVQSTIIHFRTWEPNVSRTFEEIVREGDTVVDVGANIGYYTLLLSKLVGPTGRVISIEALPKLAAVVERHVEANRLGNVRVVNIAAAAEPGEVTLYEGPATNIGHTTTRADRGQPATDRVKALPLTDILSADELSKVTLIKIDIEGGEVPVVSQILDNISLFSDRLAIEVEASVSDNPEWENIFNRFYNMGFMAYSLPNRFILMWKALLSGSGIEPRFALNSLPLHQTDILFTRNRLNVDVM